MDGASLVLLALAALSGGLLAYVLVAGRDYHPVVSADADYDDTDHAEYRTVDRREVARRRELKVIVVSEHLPTSYSRALGTMLNRFRQMRSLSEEELAGLWGQSVAIVRAVEMGTHLPDVESFHGLCLLLNASPGLVMQQAGRMSWEETQPLGVVDPADPDDVPGGSAG